MNTGDSVERTLEHLSTLSAPLEAKGDPER